MAKDTSSSAFTGLDSSACRYIVSTLLVQLRLIYSGDRYHEAPRPPCSDRRDAARAGSSCSGKPEAEQVRTVMRLSVMPTR